ncbi:hypothetical protein [Actinomadura bangladeshensis]|uniref:LppX_LprAFG lipoprotein n=1 Tax=Actinomadura bangladeshensis TaxID=453573 RepID=A0A4R4P451_9ACTN|nr:hypothetical protein [Actinomadura bangladeshensis]TDC17171.1 hypothetical protein E1284_09990 [Actinomadura bangladeshensis]
MNVRDQRLTTALGSLAGAPPSPAPVDEVLRRGRRAKRTRRAAVLGASTTAAAAGALAVALAAGPASGTAPGTAPGDADGRTSLVAAVEATAATSFKVEMANTMRQGDRPAHVERYRGAFDAAKHRGYLRGPLSARTAPELRFIGGKTYVHRGEWKEVEGGFSVLSRGTLAPASLAADPASLLKRLSTLGKVTSAGGGTYTFSYVPAKTGGPPTGDRVTGTVTVADQKVRRIEQKTVIRSATPEIADRDPVHFTSVIDFSGYGTPVHLDQP